MKLEMQSPESDTKQLKGDFNDVTIRKQSYGGVKVHLYSSTKG